MHGLTINVISTEGVYGNKADIPERRAVKYDSDGELVLCGAGEVSIGVSRRQDDTQVFVYTADWGDKIPVDKGTVEYECNTVIAPGTELAAGANGIAVAAIAGDFVIGIAKTAGAVGGSLIVNNTINYIKA